MMQRFRHSAVEWLAHFPVQSPRPVLLRLAVASALAGFLVWRLGALQGVIRLDPHNVYGVGIAVGWVLSGALIMLAAMGYGLAISWVAPSSHPPARHWPAAGIIVGLDTLWAMARWPHLVAIHLHLSGAQLVFMAGGVLSAAILQATLLLVAQALMVLGVSAPVWWARQRAAADTGVAHGLH